MPQTNDIFTVDLISEDVLEIELYDEDVFDIVLESGNVFDIELIVGGYVYENDYNQLINKPSINGVELQNNKTFEQLGREDIRNQRIKQIIDDQYEAIFGGS